MKTLFHFFFFQSQTVDILQSIIKLSPFSFLEQNTLCETFILRDLAISLSSCIYQSLSGSEGFMHKSEGATNFFTESGIDDINKLRAVLENSPLIGAAEVHKSDKLHESNDRKTTVCISPSKWPGVTNLRALLSRERDEDMPKLNVLLLESFLATYISMAFYALVTCDSRILYRLVAVNLSTEAWFSIFGGGKRTIQSRSNKEPISIQLASTIRTSFEESSDENIVSIAKQRVKLNMKLLGPFAANSSGSVPVSNNNQTSSNIHSLDEKLTYTEDFVAPESSMISYFLSKPKSVIGKIVYSILFYLLSEI